MSYCQQLFEKLTEWQASLAEMGKAKDEYLKVFGDGKKQQYEEKKREALESHQRYLKYKNEDCFVETQFEHQIEKLFGPEHDALQALCASFNIETKDIYTISITDGRIVELSIANKGSVKRIAGLNNIKYFSRLKILTCHSNGLEQLPDLPNSLEELDCSSNQIGSISILPKGLKKITCGNNNITSLPEDLPADLLYLSCGKNKLEKLPELPDGLLELWCSGNRLKQLPELPDSLKDLNFEHNLISELPQNLPNNLETIICGFNRLYKLPDLPPGLKELACNNNKITEIPSLPATLLMLYCYNNKLSRKEKKRLEEYSQSHHFTISL